MVLIAVNARIHWAGGLFAFKNGVFRSGRLATPACNMPVRDVRAARLGPTPTATTRMASTYTISDLAREFDLTTRAMRFYEDMGLLQPQRSGPGGRQRVYTARDRTRLKLTLRAKRLGLSLTEAREIIDCYDSPRDTAPQLRKFLDVLAEHRKKLEAQMLDLQANLDEVRTHEKDAKALLLRAEKARPAKATPGLAA
jgi:DNA-binding transcriptional MerR regulator